MWSLVSRGWTQQRIAEKYEITQSAVALALRQFRESLPEDEKAIERAMMREFYRENMEAFADIAALGPIPAYSNGRPIVIEVDEDGTPIEIAQDWSTVIKAREAAMRAADSVRKMLGLDEATKIDASGEIQHTIIGIPVEDI
jgi:hypothetical protein